jgi:hypothetical protein
MFESANSRVSTVGSAIIRPPIVGSGLGRTLVRTMVPPLGVLSVEMTVAVTATGSGAAKQEHTSTTGT